jgi:hypothetical protein
MEDFEEVALSRAAYKPAFWFCYMDDSSVVWPHGPKEQSSFLNHINNSHPTIHFTMESDSNNHFPSSTLTYTKDQMAPRSTVYIGSPPTPISI